MPRARFTSPYFGDGMNNLAEALYKDPTADVRAGLMGDQRKLTQAQERKAIAQAVLEELTKTRQDYNDNLATRAPSAFPNINPAMAELAARGGGTFNQQASGINTLMGADAAQGGDHYLSMALQGKMPGPDYAPSADRADEVSGRNASEAYRQATDVAGIGANSRIVQTLLQEQGKDRRPNAGRAPLNVSPTNIKHLREQIGGQLVRRLEASGVNASDSDIASMVDQLVDYATSNYQDTRDAGAAVDMVLEAAMPHIGQTEPTSFLGMNFGGGDPYLKPSWGEHRQESLGRPGAPGVQPNQNAGLMNQLLTSLGIDPAVMGAAPPEAIITDAETPEAAAPEVPPAAAQQGVMPLADALGLGAGAFPPAAAPQPQGVMPLAEALGLGAGAFTRPPSPEEQAVDPATQNLSHTSDEVQLPRVQSPADLGPALEAAGHAISQGANPAVILSKLELMGVDGESLTRFREALKRAGITLPEG